MKVCEASCKKVAESPSLERSARRFRIFRQFAAAARFSTLLTVSFLDFTHYRHALRKSGLHDRITGFGLPLEKH